MSAQLAWRAPDQASKARTAANCRPFPLQTRAFLARLLFWPCNLLHERYNLLESATKMEISVKGSHCSRALQPLQPGFAAGTRAKDLKHNFATGIAKVVFSSGRNQKVRALWEMRQAKLNRQWNRQQDRIR